LAVAEDGYFSAANTPVDPEPITAPNNCLILNK